MGFKRESGNADWIHRSCVHDPNRIAKAVKDVLAERVAREKTPEQHERDARGRSAEWHQTQANIKAAVEQAAADQAAFREMIAGKGYASPEAFHDKVNPKSEPSPAPETSPYVTRADLVTSLTRSLASIVKRAMDGGDHTTALDAIRATAEILEISKMMPGPIDPRSLTDDELKRLAFGAYLGAIGFDANAPPVTSLDKLSPEEQERWLWIANGVLEVMETPELFQPHPRCRCLPFVPIEESKT